MFTWLMRQLEAQPRQTLLDVACSNAQLGQIVQQAGLIYYGVDVATPAEHALSLTQVDDSDALDQSLAFAEPARITSNSTP